LQKDVTHNEALTIIDALIAPAVEARGVNVPPPTPQPGQCWLVGNAPTGVWAGAAQALACWTAGGWRIVTPRTGMEVRMLSGPILHYDGAGWIAPPSVTGPQGGTVIDIELRAAFNALVTALRNQGRLEQI
jgi:hypothetical protein